jgi:hypothetical protein
MFGKQQGNEWDKKADAGALEQAGQEPKQSNQRDPAQVGPHDRGQRRATRSDEGKHLAE